MAAGAEVLSRPRGRWRVWIACSLMAFDVFFLLGEARAVATGMLVAWLGGVGDGQRSRRAPLLRVGPLGRAPLAPGLAHRALGGQEWGSAGEADHARRAHTHRSAPRRRVLPH